jgi:hypothetical protein
MLCSSKVMAGLSTERASDIIQEIPDTRWDRAQCIRRCQFFNCNLK